ncbi:hypothetical protein PG996_006796 [Apiospora saccharicola]|uniref:Ribosomal RNA methyltransferase FtsJ domain-containing protein n=1 Tax=Apiospora saccharicola TaxID=335842 RepID=A0ABR1VCC5_9PEZI
MKNISIDTRSQDDGGPIHDETLVRVGLCAPTYQASHLAQRETDEKTKAVVKYVLAEAAEFRTLSDLRRKGWESSDGDKAFQEQRKRADNLGKDVSEFNYKLMGRIAEELQRFLDVTMLAEDMGITLADIPADHPDAAKFLPRQLGEKDLFNLVLCDGHILRTQDRSSGPTSDPDNKNYRELYEIYRLKYVQLALGLEHMKPGGTLVVLLHKVETWNTLCTFRRLARISDRVQLHKPHVSHTTRSSFYLVATGVDSTHPEAADSVAKWKAV